jgi:ferredoxin
VTAPERLAEIASVLGVEVGEAERRVARLHCAGGRSSVRQLAEYRGRRSCRAAHVVNGGGKACAWGCLGLGDCETACTFDAIRMTVEDLPAVEPDLCTACGDCVAVCPLDLFTLEPVSSKVLVQCSAPLTGEAAREACRVACDTCGRCALDAGEGVIEMSGGLPVVLDATRARPDCTHRCPTGAIVWLEGEQFRGVERLETVEVRRG